MELSNLHTNHNEIILPIGLKLLVKPKRLRLDSAQHGPRAKEEKKVSSGQAPPRAHIRPVPPTQSAPGQVLLRPRGFTQDEADPNCEASMPSPRLHSSQGQGGSSLLAPPPLTTGGAGWLSPGCSKTGRFSEAGIWSSSSPNPRAPRLPSWSWLRISVAVSIETRQPAVVGAGRNGTGRGYASTRPRRPTSPQGGRGRGLLEKGIGVGSPGCWCHPSSLAPARLLLHPWPGSYGN